MRRSLAAFLPLTLLTLGLQQAAAEQKVSAEGFSDQWNILLGVGIINRPRYPGSRFDYTQGVPAVSVSYGRYFLGGSAGGGAPAGLGAYLVRTEHWTVGLSLGGDFRKPRRESDAPVLHGWGNIPGTVRGGLFATYSIEWLSIHGSVSASGHDQGVTASLNPEVELHPVPRLTLSFGPSVQWANDQYAMTFFGIDAAQGEIAGVAPYRAKGGINMVGVKAGARYLFTNHWMMSVNVNAGRLQGDAARSPITTDKTQREINAFILYRF